MMTRFCIYLLCLFVAGASCKKKEQTKAETAKVVADVGSVAFPKEVVGFAGIKSFDRFVAMAGDLVSKFNPAEAPMVGAQIPALLQGMVLRVKNLAWLDGSKVVRIILLDPDTFERPFVVLFPTKGRESALQALPDNKASGAPQNEWRYTSPNGLTIFANSFGNLIAFSFDEKAFGFAKQFFDKDFQNYDFQSDIDVQVSLSNLKPKVLRFFEDLKASMLERYGDESGASPMQSMQTMLSEQVETLKKFVDQAETLRLAMDYDSKDLKLRFGAKVATASDLEKFVLQTKDKKIESYKELPKDAWVVVAQNIDPSVLQGFETLAFKSFAQALSLGQDEEAKVKSLLQQLLDVQTGDSAFALFEDQGLPIAMMGVSGVKDGEKARKLTYELSSILLPSFGALAKKAKGSEKLLKDIDFSSMTAFVNTLKPVVAKDGVTLSLSSKEASGVKMDVLGVEVVQEKVPETYKAVAEAQKKFLGDKVELGFGFAKQKGYFVLARDASRVSFKGLETGGVIGTVLNKDFRVAMFAYVSFEKLLEVASKFYPVLGGATNTPAGGSFVVFSLGAHDERVIDAEISLPIASIGALVAQKAQPQP
jgi:hypothetical protein